MNDTLSHPAHLSLDNEVSLIIRGVENNRLAAAMGAVGGLLLALAIVFIHQTTNALDKWDAAVALFIFVVHSICAYGLWRWVGQQLYNALLIWICSSMLGGLVLLANALFGASRVNAHPENLPYFSIYLLVIAMFTYAYLRRPTARWLVVGFSVIASALTLFSIAQHEQLMIGQWVLFFTCSFLLLGIMLQMELHLHMQTLRLRNAAEQEFFAEQENRRLRRLWLEGESTGALNEKGVHDGLSSNMAEAQTLQMATIQLRDYDKWRCRLGRDEYDKLNHHIAIEISDALQHSLGRAAQWGLIPGSLFVLWSKDINPARFERAVHDLVKHLNSRSYGGSEKWCFHFGLAAWSRKQHVKTEQAIERLLHDAELQLFKALSAKQKSEQRALIEQHR